MKPLLELLVGRALTRAEEHIDVVAIDEALNDGKDELEQTIEEEKERVIRALVSGRSGRMGVTRPMRAVLEHLHSEGQRHGRDELESMGYDLRDARGFDAVSDLAGDLKPLLGAMTIRIRRALEDLATDAMIAALLKIPGARNAAAEVVSRAFISGLAVTYEQHADLIPGWQYTGINDKGHCPRCSAHDGEEYDTLDALFAVLPNFGPNPDCRGGNRCRCRAVPLPPEEA